MSFDADALWRCYSLHCLLDTSRDIEHMSGQRFVNLMIACNLPHHENLTAPALRVIAIAAARGHVWKQQYDSGHTATRIYKSQQSLETTGRVTTHGRKLSYEDFLNALMRVVKRLGGLFLVLLSCSS